MNTKALLLVLALLFAGMLSPKLCLAEGKPVIISGSQSYAPFYYRDNRGNVTGIFADFWKLWARKTNTDIEFETKPFAQVLERVKEGQADVIAGFFHSPERSQRYDYSEPFYEIQTHIFFHEHIFGLKDIEDLAGFTIGIVKGDYAEEYVRNKLPTAMLALFTHYEDLIGAAVEGKIKVFICDTPVALFYLSKHGHVNNFKQTTSPLYASRIYAGVQKGNKALLDLINTGMDQISLQDWSEINQRWQGINTMRHFPWGILGAALAAIILMASGLLLWNYQLRRRVAQATANLKEQQRRLEESEKSLQQGNEQLEQRVHLRTLQMQKTNLLLADQIDKHAKTEKRLAQHNAYLSALHETMIGLMRRLNLQELLEAIMQRATIATGTKHGYIYLKDEHSDNLVCRIGTGLFATAIGYQLNPSEGLAGKVLKNSRYMLVEDYHNWEGRHPESRWDGLGAVIGIPLTSGTQVVGVLGLCFMRSEGSFGRDEITFLNGFAELASIALDNARLHQDLQNELTERKRNEAERIRLKERIQHAQKMEAIGTLAGGIAHDFNNILAVIVGNLELAMQDTPPDSPMHDFLQDGFQSSIRARDLIQQILTFGRKGTQETHPMKVAPVIAEGIKLIRASIPSSIEIRQQLMAEDAVIKASPVQIHQVLMNLSVNAAHAMEENGGALEFRLRKTKLNGDFCSQNPDIAPGEYVKLSVRDSGHGIAPEVMPRIFEPYFTTKEMERGTGLGLSVVHGIVQSHHGLITVESTPKQGTIFHIYLPICNGGVACHPAPVVTDIGGNESILFVDDEPDLTRVSCKALKNLGYKVTSCADGTEALDLFKKAPEQFDLVVTDMTMPRMNGDKLAMHILALRPELPIIICTGFSHLLSMERAHEIGIRSLMMKPVFMDDLSRTIRQVLDTP